MNGNTVGIHTSGDHGQNEHGGEAVGHRRPREHAHHKEGRQGSLLAQLHEQVRSRQC